jgi:uncharacterized protein (DUF433 family)
MNNNKFVEHNPKKLGGVPVFQGTRVPIRNLFECLEVGENLDEFLDQYPTVTREQVLGVLELYQNWLTENYEIAA